MNRIFPTLVAGVMFVAACGTQPITVYPEQAAVLSSSSPEAAGKISEAINSLLNKDDVAIATDAFTDTDLLVIHRTQILGRDLGVPGEGAVERFRLVKQSEDCILIHEGTGNRKDLEDVSCEVLASEE